MKSVVLQPSYIPWRGYFHQIYKSDVFVFYDDVQYDKHGWRNRNRIKTPAGTQWLTIPVNSKGNIVNNTLIKEIEMCQVPTWHLKHLATLKQFYGKAPYFKDYMPLLERYYLAPPRLLVDFTIDLILTLAQALNINGTRFIRSSELNLSEIEPTKRLLEILLAIGADHYISGPSAKDYLQEEDFTKLGITLEYMEYHYPEYHQLYPPYDPQVTILDLLFMMGPQAGNYIWKSSEQN